MTGALPKKILKSALRVLLVLLVLGGIAYAWMSLSYDDEGPRLQANEGLGAVEDAMSQVQDFYQDKHRFPKTGELTGLQMQTEPHVRSATLGDGGIFTIVYSGRREIDGKNLFLTPYFDKSGMLQWNCRLPDIDPRWWPDYCRLKPAA
jgi:hypothetical protein